MTEPSDGAKMPIKNFLQDGQWLQIAGTAVMAFVIAWLRITMTDTRKSIRMAIAECIFCALVAPTCAEIVMLTCSIEIDPQNPWTWTIPTGVGAAVGVLGFRYLHLWLKKKFGSINDDEK